MLDTYNPDENLYEKNENSEQENDCFKSCEKIVHQKAKITLPLSIEPYAITGKIKTRCCGTPTVTINPCCDCKNTCHYLITQEICIEFPIKFGAFTELEDTHVECERIHLEDSYYNK